MSSDGVRSLSPELHSRGVLGYRLEPRFFSPSPIRYVGGCGDQHFRRSRWDRRLQSSESGEGNLRGMAVNPEWHGSGLSTSLLETAEDELSKAGCKTITLDTTGPLKRAIRFYEKNGFRPTGKVGCFFGMPLIEFSKPIGR